MKQWSILSAALVAAMWSGSTLAADPQIATMATILKDINHYPSDTEKQRLREIADSGDATEGEKAVATAMINLQHQASAADKQKLEQIMNDESASQEVKTLARIVHDLNHKPSAQDREKLSALAQ